METILRRLFLVYNICDSISTLLVEKMNYSDHIVTTIVSVSIIKDHITMTNLRFYIYDLLEMK